MFLCRLSVWLFLKAVYKDGKSEQWHVVIFNHEELREVPEGQYVVVKMELKTK